MAKEHIDKIKWLYYRTKSMTLPEMLYRTKWKLRQSIKYKLLSQKKISLSIHLVDNEIVLSKKQLFEKFLNTKSPFESIECLNLQEYDKLINKKDIIALADKYCEKKFTIFEFNDVVRKTSSGQVDFMTDFKSGKKWPKIFSGDIYHNTKDMSIAYTWEITRMLHLYTLGKAYILTKDEKYAKEIVDNISAWIEQNPYLKGPNWFASLEIAVAMISWCWSLSMIKDSPSLDENKLDEFTRYIYLIADYVFHNMALYSSANNHLVAEASGLMIAGTFFPWLRDADKWKKKSIEILDEEITKQFLSDGVPAEQTLNYGLFTMDYFLLGFLAHSSLQPGKELPEKFKQRLSLVAKFYYEMLDEFGNVPNIGDSDEGRVTELNVPWWYNKKAGNNAVSLLKTAAIILGDNSFLNHPYIKKNPELDEKTYWLLGSYGVNKYNRLLNKSVKNDSESCKHLTEEKFCCFPVGGYSIFSGICKKNEKSNFRLVFDHGPLGYLSIAAHGHADALSTILFVDGKEFLVDPGTFVYHEGAKWRDYFRSTIAHNTVRIDGVDQSEMQGVSIWGKKANSQILSSVDTKELSSCCAKHDGYTRLNKPVIHQREIVNDKIHKNIIIHDSFTGKGSHLAEIAFNLHPKVIVSKIGQNKFALKRENITLFIEFDSKDIKLDVALHKGEVSPITGWYSSSFGKKEATTTIIAKGIIDASRKQLLSTRIIL